MTVHRLAVSAPAKINLDLAVLGVRDDGFHEIRTTYRSIDLADRLTAEPAPAGRIELDVEPVGAVAADDRNLVKRAASALARATGTGAGARLRLTKKVPVGGGLGGGSADAAATLVLLDRLWGCGLDDGSLHRLAAGLGSDVPFLLEGGSALGLGRGDDLIPLPDDDPLAVLVVAPRIRVATAEVFRRLGPRLTSLRPEGNVYAFVAGRRRRPDWRELTNELEPIVVDGWPEVGEALRFLRETGAVHAALSGSGAAGFALFSESEAARRAAAGVPAGWFVHVGETLPRGAARLADRVEVMEVDDEGDRGSHQPGQGRQDQGIREHRDR